MKRPCLALALWPCLGCYDASVRGDALSDPPEATPLRTYRACDEEAPDEADLYFLIADGNDKVLLEYGGPSTSQMNRYTNHWRTDGADIFFAADHMGGLTHAGMYWVLPDDPRQSPKLFGYAQARPIATVEHRDGSVRPQDYEVPRIRLCIELVTGAAWPPALESTDA